MGEEGRSSKRESKASQLYSKKVDTTKVNLPIIKQWIDDQINEQLPDDDIAAGFIYELVAGEENPDIHAIETQTNEFLGEKESRAFCKQLWKHLLSAQEDKEGIPEQLLEERKKMLEEQKKAVKESRQEYRSEERNRGWYQRDRRDDRRGGYRGGDRDRYGSYRQQRSRDTSNDDRKKTNYNRSTDGESQKTDKYEEDHHDARERGPRDRTLL
ncbi:hypothetical protein FT663_02703 [Candidozyma haemuli var. vulneris]|uniref:U1 small nuclear ribonucleoprotein component SNU71 n=1 Tax=Candidozyma haemuli TaxID=45357 RepID=A0A2V1B0Z7_9ASCO|nr:hypothetical protein CXQ85_002555 [[Candida] haemuloni]KAF3987744.1 hypothetical protein FT662_03817 [[Candida] haemuloni var. vulneris]KAF3991517.1 hypothetical protein FT663_02703 [[Candida] haemuloni var. vulneris]PVH22831.1 hypothetical protein CXQ85_002555 [[Candida] haemuloni]